MWLEWSCTDTLDTQLPNKNITRYIVETCTYMYHTAVFHTGYRMQPTNEIYTRELLTNRSLHDSDTKRTKRSYIKSMTSRPRCRWKGRINRLTISQRAVNICSLPPLQSHRTFFSKTTCTQGLIETHFFPRTYASYIVRMRTVQRIMNTHIYLFSCLAGRQLVQ